MALESGKYEGISHNCKKLYGPFGSIEDKYSDYLEDTPQTRLNVFVIQINLIKNCCSPTLRAK